MASISTTPKFSVSQISLNRFLFSPNTTKLSFPPSISFPSTSTSLLKTKTITSSLPPSSSPSPSLTRPVYVPNKIPDPNYVRIFDTTLRDGEQSPGATLTSKEKLDIARQLAKLGVDIIEAGFPAASKDDFEAVKMIANEVGNQVDSEGYVPVICGLSRCNEKDIRAAWEAVKNAKRPRIHTFIATSGIHMEYKLRKSKEEVVEIASSMVRFARSLGCDDVEFSPEDAGRSEREFLYHILGEVIKAGATTLNIPDTVGITTPSEFGQLIADIKANTPGIENVIISTHCQNDLGLSTANTLSGACAGARQVEVTINGIGERAGNASLEEVVMVIKCRGEHVLGGLYTGINTRHITMASKMVEEYTGLHVQPHKAIVGANAFAHESGIHQDGMLKHKGTYEIISPEDIGLERSNDAGIVLGKLSGRHALKDRLNELGYELDDAQLGNIFWRFKAVAETKKRVTDADLIALVSDEVFQPENVWKLHDLQVTCGTLGLSTATVKLLSADGEEHVACSLGTGPVDSAYKAVNLIVKEPVTLLEYSMIAVTEGIDAIATTRVVIRGENQHAPTHALTDEPFQRTFSGSGGHHHTQESENHEKEAIEEEQEQQEEKARCEWDFSLTTIVSSGNNNISSTPAISDALGVIEFDQTNSIIATGGIARKIRIYNFKSLFAHENTSQNAHEITCLDHARACDYYICTPAKLSSIRWKPSSDGRVLGSGDYDGVVMEYCLERRIPIFERDEHGGRRVWSVDYSHWDPVLGASGSDDGTMQMWDTRCESGEGVATVQPGVGRSAVCCVEFNPFGGPIVAVGCADRRVYGYDIRMTGDPVFVLDGHRKTVTYIKFLDNVTLVSASIDGCLKLWDSDNSNVIRSYKGHVNSRSFIGLSVWRNGGLLGCGSENNKVFVYDRRWGEPIWVHESNPVGRDGCGGGFVSSVCWRQVEEDQCTLVAGGSDGDLQVFQGRRKS